MPSIDDVSAVFTCCLFPEYTLRAICSILIHYPDLEMVVVDDHCREHDDKLELMEKHLAVPVLRNDERVGTGRSLDKGLRALTKPFFVSVDHGVQLKQSGAIELLLDKMKPGVVGVGRKRNDKRCNKAFGPYVDPVFALWDREFILEHDDLTFALTFIRIGDWQVNGCSTAQFLQYRVMRLGARVEYIPLKVFESHVRHHRTPHARGKCASPHELMVVDEDYLIPRRRGADGMLLYPGEEIRK